MGVEDASPKRIQRSFIDKRHWERLSIESIFIRCPIFLLKRVLMLTNFTYDRRRGLKFGSNDFAESWAVSHILDPIFPDVLDIFSLKFEDFKI